MTQKEEWLQYKETLKDIVDFCPYGPAREMAMEGLDTTKPRRPRVAILTDVKRED